MQVEQQQLPLLIPHKMKLLSLSFIFILGALSAHSQADFQKDISKRKAKIYSFTGTSLNVEVDLGESKHTSVIISITFNDGSKPESMFIGIDSAFQKSTSNIKSVTIKHKKKFLIRFSQKIKDDEKDSKGTRRIKTNRVRISSESAGGSSTSTTVNSA